MRNSNIQLVELTKSDMTQVQGGLTWKAVATAATAFVTMCYQAGQAVGEAVYHVTH